VSRLELPFDPPEQASGLPPDTVPESLAHSGEQSEFFSFRDLGPHGDEGDKERDGFTRKSQYRRL